MYPEYSLAMSKSLSDDGQSFDQTYEDVYLDETESRDDDESRIEESDEAESREHTRNCCSCADELRTMTQERNSLRDEVSRLTHLLVILRPRSQS